MKRILVILFVVLLVADGYSQRRTRWQDLAQAVKDSIQMGSVTLGAGDVSWSNLASTVQDSVVVAGYYGDYTVSAANSGPVDKKGTVFSASGNSGSFVDHLTLQAAFDSAKSDILANAAQVGATIHVLKGDVYFDNIGPENGGLVIDTSNITLIWDADGHTAASANGYDIKVVNSSNVHISGSGTLSGNAANQGSLGVGINFDNCNNVSIKGIRATDHRTANFQFRSTTDIYLEDCHADSTTNGRGFIFDREGTTGSLVRGSRRITMVGCTMRRQYQAAFRLQQVVNFLMVGCRIEMTATGGDNRTGTIANDDVTGTNVDSLEGFIIVGNDISGEGDEMEFKGLSGHGRSNLIAANKFNGTLLTIDVADFTVADTLSKTSVIGNVFDPSGFSVSRIIQTGPGWVDNDLDVSGNTLWCGGSVSNALYFRGGNVTVTYNKIYNNNARSIVFIGNVRQAKAIGNIITGTDGGGANNFAFDIEVDSVLLKNNFTDKVKWFAEIENDSTRVLNNVAFGITATGDTAIVQRGSGISSSNVYKYNFFDGFSINLSDVGASDITSDYKFENQALTGDVDKAKENNYTLGGLGGNLTLSDTVDADFLTTPTFLDTMFWGGTHHLTTNPGGDQLRIGSENSIQLLPDGDTQNTVFLQVDNTASNGPQISGFGGASYINFNDHVVPSADSSYRVGTSTLAPGGVYLYNHDIKPDYAFDTNRLILIIHDDSLWIQTGNSTLTNVQKPGRTITVP